MIRSFKNTYVTLLDENLYYGSISRMHRVSRGVGKVGERRDVASLRVGQHQVTWTAKWTYFYLHAAIHIYSRFVVGWMIADRESSTYAKLLLETTIREQGVDPTKRTVHADRGSSMKSKPIAFMLADPGVIFH